MLTEELEKKIIKYATQKDVSELKELVLDCSEEELEEVIKKTLPNSAFPKLWDCLLKAFQNCHQKRVKVVLATLTELDNQHSVSSDTCSKLIQRLCMDLVKLRMEDLVDICNFCLNSLQSKLNVKNSCSWKDLLPDTIRILSKKDTVEFNELEYSGQEFKTTFITTLCLMNWCPEKTTQLAAMFSDMTLTKEEHLKVVIKLTSYVEKLIPQELPSFVYQLLTLCRHQNGRVIFAKLQQYFGLRIYNSTNFWKDSSSESSPDLDLIENAENHEAIDAESTVLYHIQSAAALGHSCIKDHITSLKNAEKSPDFILHPFQVLVLFAISTAAQYEELVFDILRHAIVRFYVEQNKRNSSCWYREIVHATTDPEKLFTQIMDLQKRDFLLEAFSNFGFNLLSVGCALGRDTIAEKQWTLGTVIMLKLIKRKTCITPVLLRTFCNHILTRNSSAQYIDCLYYLSKTSPLLMLENQSCVVEMIESLMQIGNQVAVQLVDALIPLTKVSSAIRDQFILICRKCLYSRSLDTRLVAVYGYVKLISTLNISGKGSLSQNSLGSFSSGYSIYTQISLNRSSQAAGFGHLGNEAICWEVLGILKRTFMQQVVIKVELYNDLYNAVCVNQELAMPVLDMLWLHLMEFIIVDETVQPPLNFSKVAILGDTDCIPKEALGHLLFVVSQLAVKIDQIEDESDDTVKKHLDILDSLCERMANCELEYLNLNDGADLSDPLPECQQKLHVLKEAIQVYETLIGFKIANLTAGRETQCRIIGSLFDGYLRFFNYRKILFKPKKGKKCDKTTQKEDISTDNSTLNGSKKSNSGAKCASKILALSDTLFNFAIVSKGLKTLLEPNVPWVSANDASALRTRVEVHRHFLRAAMVVMGKYKNYKAIDTVYKKIDYDHIISIAETIYNNIICKLNDYLEFDCISAILGIECFNNILLLVNSHFKSNLLNFLSKVGGKNKNETLASHLKPMLEVFEKIFEKDEDELTAADPEVKKYHPAVLSNMSTLCTVIPQDNYSLSLEVYEWLKQIAYNNSIPVKVASGFMTLMCDLHVRFKSGLTLLEHASNSFGDVYGAIRDDDSIIENEETLKIVNSGTANSIIQSICSCIKTVLDDTENVISRLKSDWYILNYPGEDNNTNKESLRSKEKGVSGQLCYVSRILTNLLKLALPAGAISDGVFKNVVQLYSCLSSLTKYLISRSTQTAIHGMWFEKLIKIVGKRLAPAVYDFVYHQNQGAQPKSDGSSLKNKILRETKAIPKVIYEIEQFGRHLMLLSKKSKFDFTKYLGQGTSRDFRIDLKVFQQDLKRGAEDSTQSDNDDSVNSSSIVNESVGESSIGNEGDSEIPSPAKRRRK